MSTIFAAANLTAFATLTTFSTLTPLSEFQKKFRLLLQPLDQRVERQIDQLILGDEWEVLIGDQQ